MKYGSSYRFEPQGEIHFSLADHIRRQREWGLKTFGPGARTAGVCDHIRKELKEVEAAPFDLSEWIDVIILGLDGAQRTGATPDDIVNALVAKADKNEDRAWPDWRTADPDKAIEHDRSGEEGDAVATIEEVPSECPGTHTRAGYLRAQVNEELLQFQNPAVAAAFRRFVNDVMRWSSAAAAKAEIEAGYGQTAAIAAACLAALKR